MSIKVGVGVSTARDCLTAAKEATTQARISLKESEISLAIVFSSIQFANPNLLQAITDLLGPVPLLGCSGLAIISNQGIFKHGLIIMLLSLPERIYFNIACAKDISKKSVVNAGEELGEKLLYGFNNVRRDFSVIFSDGLIADSSELIPGLQERLGMSFPIIGASASDNLAFKNTYQYFNQEVFNDGACGMLWGGKLNFGMGTKHGWKPLGKPHRVTMSRGNVVYKIEDAPAVRIYADYLARNIDQLKKELKRISILYPIGIYLPGEDEYLLRNILSIEDDGAVVFQGDIPQDSDIRLMIGTKESCLSATGQALEEVKKALGTLKINFLMVFDSVSRYILLGRQANKELEIIRDGVGGDVPIIGLYTYGEQAPLRAINYLGKTYFHNQTISILGIAA